MWAELKGDLQAGRLVPSLMVGAAAGLMVSTGQVSYAVLIFGGALSPHLGWGIGLGLLAAAVANVTIALRSSLPGVVAEPQDSPAVILAVAGVAIVAGLPPGTGDETLLATVLATIALTALLAGLLFLGLGWLKQGGLVRYVPYPVVGGFSAGVGYLLAQGGMSVLAGAPLSLAGLPALLQGEALLRWLPGLLLAVAIVLVLRRYSHFLILPGIIVAAVVLFYLVMALAGVSPAEALAGGWLLGPLPVGALWRPLTPAVLAQVHWPSVLAQAGAMATILVVSLVSLLLNCSGVELIARRDMDLNRELRAAGLANLLTGLVGGGPVAYHMLSASSLSYRVGATSRLVGLVAAAGCLGMLLAGPGILGYLPMVVPGGLVLFLGLAFLVEWLYDAWFRLSRLDYAVVVAILLATIAWGPLLGVVAGLALTLFLFVVQYSRLDVVRHAFSGATRRSYVDRPRLYDRLLQQKGDWLYILELEGYLFFGTAHRLLDRVRTRLQSPASCAGAETGRPAPHFAVLDFRRVTGMDASAVLSFIKLLQVAQGSDLRLVFTHLSPAMLHQLQRELPPPGDDDPLWRTFPDLDHGLEWCEDRLIALFQEVGLAARPRPLLDQLAAVLPRRGAGQFFAWLDGLKAGDQQAAGDPAAAPAGKAGPLSGILPYMEHLVIQPGQVLIRQGEPRPGLYFVEEGQVTICLEREGAEALRLRRRGAGTIVGEVGLYLGTPATASVVVDRPGQAYHLSAEALQRLEAEAPALAAALHRFLAAHLSQRLVSTTELVRELGE